MAWSRDPNRRRGIPAAKRARVMAEHGYVCHVCHHSGSDNVDHVINWLTSFDDNRDNLAPIHQQPCPTCGRRCHVEKTSAEGKAWRQRGRRQSERHPGLM